MSTIILSDSSDDEIVFFPVKSSRTDKGDDEVIFCGFNSSTTDYAKKQNVEQKSHGFPPSVSKDVTIVSNLVRRQVEEPDKDGSDDEIVFLGIRKCQASPNPASFNININSQESLKNTNVTIDIEEDAACIKKKVQLTFLGHGSRNRSNLAPSNSRTSLFNPQSSSTPRQKTSSHDVARSSNKNPAVISPNYSTTPRRRTPLDTVSHNNNRTPSFNPVISRTPRLNKAISPRGIPLNNNVNPLTSSTHKEKTSSMSNFNNVKQVSSTNNRIDPSKNPYTKIHWNSFPKPAPNIKSQNSYQLPLSSNDVGKKINQNTQISNSSVKPRDMVRNDKTIVKKHEKNNGKRQQNISSEKDKKLTSKSEKIGHSRFNGDKSLCQNEKEPILKTSGISERNTSPLPNQSLDPILSTSGISKRKTSPISNRISESVCSNSEISTDNTYLPNRSSEPMPSTSGMSKRKSSPLPNRSSEPMPSTSGMSKRKTSPLPNRTSEPMPSTSGISKRKTSPLPNRTLEPMPSTSGISKRKTSPLPNRTLEPMPSTSGISKRKTSPLPNRTLEPMLSTSGISKRSPSPLPNRTSERMPSTSGRSKRSPSPLPDQTLKLDTSTSGKSRRNPSPMSSQVSSISSGTEEDSSNSEEDSDSSSQSNQCEVPRPPMSKDALDTLFNKFLANCSKVNNALSVLKMKAKLKKFYINSNNITRNYEFIMSLKEASIKLESKSIKNPIEIMKKVLVQLRRDSPTTKMNIKKLEKALEEINKKIKQLEEAEVTSDEDEHDNSYVKLDKYRKRAVEIYNKLCELNSVPADAERPTLRNVSFHGKVPGDLSKSMTVQNLVNRVSRALERYHNKSRKFPDFHDVLILMQKLSKESGSQLKNDTLHQLARSLFEEFGDILQKRRLYDEYRICSEYLGDDDDDPYYSDPILAAKLDSNKKYRTKEKDVLQKFTMKQATLKENGLSESASHSSSEEVSDKDKKSKNKKIKQSSDEGTSETSSDEKVTSKLKSKRKALCKRASRSHSRDNKPRDKNRDKKPHRDKSIGDKEYDENSSNRNDSFQMKRNRIYSSDSDTDMEEKVKKAKVDQYLVQDNEPPSVNKNSVFLQSENKVPVEETDKIDLVPDENSRDFCFGDDDNDVVLIEEKNDNDAQVDSKECKISDHGNENLVLDENSRDVCFEDDDNDVVLIEEKNDNDAQVDSKECEISDHGNENLLNSSGLLITNVMSCQDNFTQQDQTKETEVVPTIDLLSDDEEPNASGRNVLTPEEILEIIPCVLNQTK